MTHFKLNGKAVSTDVSADTPLLWVLRDALDLTGTKFGCGIGICGACVVHVNGDPARACTTLLSEVEGRNVTTIEGMAGDRIGAVVQRAWQDLEVVQCGYCQSGQIMSATALLASNRKPSDADIDAAMGANLCRCATYVRIRAAIHAAARTLG